MFLVVQPLPRVLLVGGLPTCVEVHAVTLALVALVHVALVDVAVAQLKALRAGDVRVQARGRRRQHLLQRRGEVLLAGRRHRRVHDAHETLGRAPARPQRLELRQREVDLHVGRQIDVGPQPTLRVHVLRLEVEYVGDAAIHGADVRAHNAEAALGEHEGHVGQEPRLVDALELQSVAVDAPRGLAGVDAALDRSARLAIDALRQLHSELLEDGHAQQVGIDGQAGGCCSQLRLHLAVSTDVGGLGLDEVLELLTPVLCVGEVRRTAGAEDEAVVDVLPHRRDVRAVHVDAVAHDHVGEGEQEPDLVLAADVEQGHACLPLVEVEPDRGAVDLWGRRHVVPGVRALHPRVLASAVRRRHVLHADSPPLGARLEGEAQGRGGRGVIARLSRSARLGAVVRGLRQHRRWPSSGRSCGCLTPDRTHELQPGHGPQRERGGSSPAP
mmetsp:Transcript_68947/g.202387  ORF Transcript_68947/g.202387 Transcript_68947/m.202387 type:complete len:442 (+) Transcript_68947:2407-3732(+)